MKIKLGGITFENIYVYIYIYFFFFLFTASSANVVVDIASE